MSVQSINETFSEHKLPEGLVTTATDVSASHVRRYFEYGNDFRLCMFSVSD